MVPALPGLTDNSHGNAQGNHTTKWVQGRCRLGSSIFGSLNQDEQDTPQELTAGNQSWSAVIKGVGWKCRG